MLSIPLSDAFLKKCPALLERAMKPFFSLGIHSYKWPMQVIDVYIV
jgi:hypothetical protein